MNNVKAFVAVTNLFDKQIITGKNQTVTNIGAPLTVWGGLKTRFRNSRQRRRQQRRLF